MTIENAPAVEDADEKECGLCEAEGTFVIHEGDKLCTECGHAPSSRRSTVETDRKDEWQQWFEHRAEHYSGFYGEDRVKMVGGFESAY